MTRTAIVPYLLTMKVNAQHFFTGTSGRAVLNAVARIRKRHPERKYTTATEEGGVRVWRLA